MIAWAKHDPVRIDQPLPTSTSEWLGEPFGNTIKRYGDVMYAICLASENRERTALALKAMLDMFLAGHGVSTLSSSRRESADIEASYMAHIMPNLDRDALGDMLAMRRYVIVEGPPGTGKTRMAVQLIEKRYAGNGISIQFHPNTTYESFIGGLSPVPATGDAGLAFYPKAGALLSAIVKAKARPEVPYLLHVDEINRADLAKVLGEAIYLFESQSDSPRRVALDHRFEGLEGLEVEIPANLHVLGTMNSADRSIAILDMAIRRRFAFVSLWPQAAVVAAIGCELMKEAFDRLLGIFVDHASDEALMLMPGHSYFLESQEPQAKTRLRTELQPLLNEYLSQGYVSGFAGEIASYLQWLEAKTA